jgi:hypothetical protein
MTDLVRRLAPRVFFELEFEAEFDTMVSLTLLCNEHFCSRFREIVG